MRPKYRNARRAALRLDSRDRAELAAEILASLDAPADPNVDAAWENEIRNRIAALNAGKVELEPWDTVKQRIKRGILGR